MTLLDVAIKSFSRYTKGHVSEQGEWIVIYDGDDLIVNRKGNSKVLHIKRPFVSLIGSIQPYILCDAFKGAGTEDGLLWRILMTHSEHPACPLLWNDEQPDENLCKDWSKIILSIFDQSLGVDYEHPKQIRYTENGWSTVRKCGKALAARIGCSFHPAGVWLLRRRNRFADPGEPIPSILLRIQRF